MMQPNYLYSVVKVTILPPNLIFGKGDCWLRFFAVPNNTDSVFPFSRLKIYSFSASVSVLYSIHEIPLLNLLH